MRDSSLRGFAINLRMLNFLARRARLDEMRRYAIGLVRIPSFSLETFAKSSSENINSCYVGSL